MRAVYAIARRGAVEGPSDSVVRPAFVPSATNAEVLREGDVDATEGDAEDAGELLLRHAQPLDQIRAHRRDERLAGGGEPARRGRAVNAVDRADLFEREAFGEHVAED